MTTKRVPPKRKEGPAIARPKLAYRTGLGRAYQGDAVAFLSSVVKPRSVDLLVMSPPFALTREKDYGNRNEREYVKWFLKFVAPFRRVLKDTGSLVIDIGGAYLPGRPQRSTYHFELAVELAKRFELCQEFYWYNPAKLPSPAEWVNVRRTRVKDSVDPVYWFAKDAARAKADNQRVLKRYSKSMESLLKNGYQYRSRPSGHQITNKFSRRHQGAIPPNLLGFKSLIDSEELSGLEDVGEAFETHFPNLLALSNTGSNARYQKLCLEHGLKPHPARFPLGLPAFFIEFLTEPGDLICDPFAGSNTTGEAAETLGRRWVSCDLDQEGAEKGSYVRGSAFRFPSATMTRAFEAVPKGSYRAPARLASPEVQPRMIDLDQ